MLKKLPLMTAAIAAFVFVLVTIAHACSGLGSTSMAAHQGGRSINASDSLPCGNQKHDVCESVRDGMLSIKPPAPGTDSLTGALSSVSMVVPSPRDLSVVPKVTKAAFHAVFKLRLSFSYLVLRL